MPRPRTPSPKAAGGMSAAGVVTAPASIKSAARVLAIFELFDQERRPLKVGEIAARLDLPQSSTSLLLRTLVGLGYIAADPVRRTYGPTARVGLLGSWCVGTPLRNGGITRLIEALSRDTGQTVILAGRNGIYAQYFHVVQATLPLRMHVPAGTLRMLAWSTPGFVILQDATEAEIRSLVHRTNAELGAAHKRLSAAGVLARIAGSRSAGYAFSRALVTAGTGMIAVRLPGDAAGPKQPLAICVSGWVDAIARDERLIVELIRAAIRTFIHPGQPDP